MTHSYTRLNLLNTRTKSVLLRIGKRFLLIYLIIFASMLVITPILEITSLNECIPYVMTNPACNKYTKSCLNSTLSHGYFNDNYDINEWNWCIDNLRSQNEINKIKIIYISYIIIIIHLSIILLLYVLVWCIKCVSCYSYFEQTEQTESSITNNEINREV